MQHGSATDDRDAELADVASSLIERPRTLSKRPLLLWQPPNDHSRQKASLVLGASFTVPTQTDSHRAIATNT
jgi:hypothetical protein